MYTLTVKTDFKILLLPVVLFCFFLYNSTSFLFDQKVFFLIFYNSSLDSHFRSKVYMNALAQIHYCFCANNLYKGYLVGSHRSSWASRPFWYRVLTFRDPMRVLFRAENIVSLFRHRTLSLVPPVPSYALDPVRLHDKQNLLILLLFL